MRIVICDDWLAKVCPGPRGPFIPKVGKTYYYLFKQPPRLSGKDLDPARIRAVSGGAGARPFVKLAFTPHGNKVFKEMTRQEWLRGQTHGNQSFAIVLSSRNWSDRIILLSAVSATDPSLRDGIDPSRSGMILRGSASASAAVHLAYLLVRGSMPVYFWEWYPPISDS